MNTKESHIVHVGDDRFFRGVVREPGGSGEYVVVPRANRALAERMASKAAVERNWDWFVEHVVVCGSGEDREFKVIEQWSSLAGHEVFDGA